MTERRRTGLARPSLLSLNSFENEANASMPTTRSRPKSRLASYLHSHRGSGSSSLPETADAHGLSWSAPKDEPNLYGPDVEAMCNTLRRRIASCPSGDLPARYNSFVLHVLEHLHVVLREKAALEARLGEEREAHRKYREGGLSKVKAPGDEARRLPTGQSASDQNGPAVRQEEKQEKRKGDVSAGGRGGPKYLISPSRSMADMSLRILRGLSPTRRACNTSHPQQADSVENGPVTARQPPPRGQPSGSLARTDNSDMSSTEGDLLPDEEEGDKAVRAASADGDETVVMRLSNWLAERTGQACAEVLPEIAGILSGSAIDPARFPKSWTQVKEKPTTPASDSSGNVVAAMGDASSHHGRYHRRGFSFVPGDDAVPARQGDAPSTARAVQRPTDDEGVKAAAERDGKRFSRIGDLSTRPRREDSSRSVQTAIHTGSSSSSKEPSRLDDKGDSTHSKSLG